MSDRRFSRAPRSSLAPVCLFLLGRLSSARICIYNTPRVIDIAFSLSLPASNKTRGTPHNRSRFPAFAFFFITCGRHSVAERTPKSRPGLCASSSAYCRLVSSKQIYKSLSHASACKTISRRLYLPPREYYYYYYSTADRETSVSGHESWHRLN